jgi:hypothetical protein
MKYLSFSVWLAFCASVSFGQSAEPSLASAEDSVSFPFLWVGLDDQGERCSFRYDQNTGGGLARVVLEGTFIADYKVPMPFSGLYGKYRWPGTFDSDTNARDSLSVTGTLWGDADVIKGQGQPLFWNTGEHQHKILVKPSLQKPEVVSYEAKERVASVVTTVVISMKCRLGL